MDETHGRRGGIIALAFALPTESSGVRRLLKNHRRVVVNETTFVEGEWHDRRIALCHTGVGARACQQRIADFLEAARFTCLVSAGFAGALKEDLRVGELFVAKNFSNVDLLASSRQILASAAARFGKLVTASAMIDGAISREELRARSGAEAVDMETEFIAQACARHGIPLLSLRVISDTAGVPLPAPPDVLFNLQRQKTELGTLALYLLQHPTTIVRLTAFAHRIASARKVLTSAIDVFIRNNQL